MAKYKERLFIKIPTKEKRLLKELAELNETNMSVISRKLLYNWIHQTKSMLKGRK